MIIGNRPEGSLKKSGVLVNSRQLKLVKFMDDFVPNPHEVQYRAGALFKIT